MYGTLVPESLDAVVLPHSNELIFLQHHLQWDKPVENGFNWYDFNPHHHHINVCRKNVQWLNLSLSWRFVIDYEQYELWCETYDTSEPCCDEPLDIAANFDTMHTKVLNFNNTIFQEYIYAMQPAR